MGPGIRNFGNFPIKGNKNCSGPGFEGFSSVTLENSESGSPIQKSKSKGSAISSLKYCPIVRPSILLSTSPTRWP